MGLPLCLRRLSKKNLESLDKEPIDVTQTLSKDPFLWMPKQQNEVLFQCKQLNSRHAILTIITKQALKTK